MTGVLSPDGVMQALFACCHEISLNQNGSCIWRVYRIWRSQVLHLDLLGIASLHDNLTALVLGWLLARVVWLILHYDVILSKSSLNCWLGDNYLIKCATRRFHDLLSSVLGILGVLSIVSGHGRGLGQSLIQVLIDVNVCLLAVLHIQWLIDSDLVLSQQVVLNHVISDPKSNHRILNWVQLVDMNYAQ